MSSQPFEFLLNEVIRVFAIFTVFHLDCPLWYVCTRAMHMHRWALRTSPSFSLCDNSFSFTLLLAKLTPTNKKNVLRIFYFNNHIIFRNSHNKWEKNTLKACNFGRLSLPHTQTLPRSRATIKLSTSAITHFKTYPSITPITVTFINA